MDAGSVLACDVVLGSLLVRELLWDVVLGLVVARELLREVDSELLLVRELLWAELASEPELVAELDREVVSDAVLLALALGSS